MYECTSVYIYGCVGVQMYGCTGVQGCTTAQVYKCVDFFQMYRCKSEWVSGLRSSTVDQVLKYTKYPKYIPSTSTSQVLIFFKVLKYIKYFHIKYKYKYSY